MTDKPVADASPDTEATPSPDDELKKLIREFKSTLNAIDGIQSRASHRLWYAAKHRIVTWLPKKDVEWYERAGMEVETDLNSHIGILIQLSCRLSEHGLKYGHVEQDVSGDPQYVLMDWFDADGVVPFTGPAVKLGMLNRFPFLHKDEATDASDDDQSAAVS